MNLEGTFDVRAPRSLVWEKLTDPALMAGCIPGCEEIEQLSATSYRAVVQVKVGPIKARFNLVTEVTREEPPDAVYSATRGEEGTRASVVSADSVVRLAETNPGETSVSYSSEVSVTGRLGKFGLGVMRKKAESLSLEFVENFKKRVEPESAGA